jgi:hypothetical protein
MHKYLNLFMHLGGCERENGDFNRCEIRDHARRGGLSLYYSVLSIQHLPLHYIIVNLCLFIFLLSIACA